MARYFMFCLQALIGGAVLPAARPASAEGYVAGRYEIEMEKESEAELFFVAIRPGEYTWACRNLEEKGLTGKFSIK
jgi:hypothetical protein